MARRARQGRWTRLRRGPLRPAGLARPHGRPRPRAVHHRQPHGRPRALLRRRLRGAHGAEEPFPIARSSRSRAASARCVPRPIPGNARTACVPCSRRSTRPSLRSTGSIAASTPTGRLCVSSTCPSRRCSAAALGAVLGACRQRSGALVSRRHGAWQAGHGRTSLGQIRRLARGQGVPDAGRGEHVLSSDRRAQTHRTGS